MSHDEYEWWAIAFIPVYILILWGFTALLYYLLRRLR